jgi:hypothetical protein
MSYHEAPPFARGVSEATIGQWAGRDFQFEDRDYSSTSGAFPTLSNNMVTVRVVKNSSGIALLPSRLVRFKAGTNCTEVDGYGFTTGDKPIAVVDEYLPSAGVPNGDYFFVVTHGPTSVLTDLAAGANNLVPEESALIALTAASSQATTAGRVAPLDLTATDSTNKAIIGVFARALSAKTTAQTNNTLRAYVGNTW